MSKFRVSSFPFPSPVIVSDKIWGLSLPFNLPCLLITANAVPNSNSNLLSKPPLHFSKLNLIKTYLIKVKVTWTSRVLVSFLHHDHPSSKVEVKDQVQGDRQGIEEALRSNTSKVVIKLIKIAATTKLLVGYKVCRYH